MERLTGDVQATGLEMRDDLWKWSEYIKIRQTGHFFSFSFLFLGHVFIWSSLILEHMNSPFSLAMSKKPPLQPFPRLKRISRTEKPSRGACRTWKSTMKIQHPSNNRQQNHQKTNDSVTFLQICDIGCGLATWHVVGKKGLKALQDLFWFSGHQIWWRTTHLVCDSPGYSSLSERPP